MSVSALPAAFAAVAESRASTASVKKPPASRLMVVKRDEATAPEPR